MKYLLDTNVISEIQKSNCSPEVRLFVEKLPAQDIFMSVISIGEICYGVEKLPAGKKKHDLELWLYTRLQQWFTNRIIPVDTEIMLEWGKLPAAVNRTLPAVDCIIASTALYHNMILVTRNIKDFTDIPGMKLINPWYKK